MTARKHSVMDCGLDLRSDERIGGMPKHYLEYDRPDNEMLIPDEMRKCVGFVALEQGGRALLGGTCFIVSRPTTLIQGKSFMYAVTAKHVIDAVARNGCFDALLRLNLKGGGATWFRAPVANWWTHPTDSSVDVCVTRFVMDVAPFDHLAFPLEGAATEANLVKANARLGLGDEVFLTGLFSAAPGQARNTPIVRIGHIAALPEEKITANLGAGQFKDIDAYLIEARSIGGLSGSPVFLYAGQHTRDGKVLLGRSQFFLLGLMQGHFDSEAMRRDVIADISLGRESINMGIGIVVPVEKILEVIDAKRDEDLEVEKKELEKTGPVADENFTREDFMRDLGKVVKKRDESPQNPDEPSSKTSET